MHKEHSGLSVAFGLCVSGPLFERSIDMMQNVSQGDPVIMGGGLIIGSIVSSLAGYGTSYHANQIINTPNIQPNKPA